MMDHAGDVIIKENKRKYVLSNCGLGHNNVNDPLMRIPSIGTTRPGGKVSATQLAHQWRISLDSATKTIEATTQMG